VQKINYQRFALCVDPNALHRNLELMSLEPPKKDPKKQSISNNMYQPGTIEDMKPNQSVNSNNLRHSMQNKRPAHPQG